MSTSIPMDGVKCVRSSTPKKSVPDRSTRRVSLDVRGQRLKTFTIVLFCGRLLLWHRLDAVLETLPLQQTDAPWKPLRSDVIDEAVAIGLSLTMTPSANGMRKAPHRSRMNLDAVSSQKAIPVMRMIAGRICVSRTSQRDNV